MLQKQKVLHNVDKHCALVRNIIHVSALCICVFPYSESNLQEDLFDQILLGRLDFPSPYWDNITDSAKVRTAHILSNFNLETISP